MKKGDKYKVKLVNQLNETVVQDTPFEILIEDTSETGVQVRGSWLTDDEFNQKYLIVENLGNNRKLLFD